MAGFAGKFESARQDWTTPQDLFDTLDNEFSFTLDAAASLSNTKCDAFLGEDDDALNCSWGARSVWLNPPYGAGSEARLSRWVEKAYSESLTGSTVVMLIPARTNTNWFHDLCLGNAEVRFLRGRPKFGGAEHGLPQPLCIVVFRPSGEGAGRVASGFRFESRARQEREDPALFGLGSCERVA